MIVQTPFFTDDELRQFHLTDAARKIALDTPARWVARGGLGLVPRLALVWSILRWEKTVATALLEDLGVDTLRLTTNVDAQLTKLASNVGCAHVDCSAIRRSIDVARELAAEMTLDYVGTEHMLLAVSEDDTACRSLFDSVDVSTDELRKTIKRFCLHHGNRA